MAEPVVGEKRAAEDPPADADRRRYPLNHDFEFAFNSKIFSDRVMRLTIVPDDDEYGGLFALPSDRFYQRLIVRGLAGAEQTTFDLEEGDSANGLRPHIEVKMPDLSPTVDQANISLWMKKEGEQVSPGDFLCEVEMDIVRKKVVFCTEMGYLAKIIHGDGAKGVKAGDVIGVIVREECDIDKLNASGPSALKECSKEKLDNDGQNSSQSIAPPQIKVVKEIGINSAVVASNSKFFRTLFTIGTEESSVGVVWSKADDVLTYTISAYEEGLVMEVLSFLYSGNLSATEPESLLDILVVAHRFEVEPLINFCIQLLMKQLVTVEHALLYLHYPFTPEVLMLLAKKYLLNKFRDLTRIPEEMLDLPIFGIEAIFSTSQIRVQSEDHIHDFLVKWAYKQYPHDEDERRSVWKCRLVPLLRFSNMSPGKLNDILARKCDGLYREDTLRCIATSIAKSVQEPQPQREYLHKPIRVVRFEDHCSQATVFISLTQAECSNLFPDDKIYSHEFSLGGQEVCLSACCQQNPETEIQYFGLWVEMSGSPNVRSLTIDLNFAVRQRSGKFLSKFQERCVVTSDERKGTADLFDLPWQMFLADEDIFVDQELHLRADLTLVAQ